MSRCSAFRYPNRRHLVTCYHNHMEARSGKRLSRPKKSSALSGAEKMRRYRDRKKKAGMKLISVWVPRKRLPADELSLSVAAKRRTTLLASPLAGTRIERILAARAEERRRLASRLSRATLKHLAALGVEAKVIGSLAENRVRPNSDVDYFIEDRGGMADYKIIREIEKTMHGFPFDVIFAEYLPHGMAPMIAPRSAH